MHFSTGAKRNSDRRAAMNPLPFGKSTLKQQWAYLRKNGKVKRAYHQRFDESGKQSCSFCGVGQVWIKEGVRCAYCGSEVIKVAGGGWRPAPELILTFKARNVKTRASAVTAYG